MAGLTSKQWGALVGFLLVFSAAVIGIGATAIAILFAVGGYFVGKFLDGEIDLQELQNRARGRQRTR